MREALTWFTTKMESVLASNDHKNGKLDCSNKALYARLLDECEELNRELELVKTFSCRPNNGMREQIRLLNNVIAESVDVANFAMMIANAAREELGE